MLRRSFRVALALLAVTAAAGCGGSGSGKEAADSWLAALEEERWADACARLATPPERCEERMRESYGGRELELLPKGGYLLGDELTDNETSFAFTATDSGEPERTTVFEVVDDDRVRLVFESEQAG